MPDTIEYLNQLSDERAALAQNLITKGVEVDTSATFTELVPKVLEIEGGGEGKDYSSEIVYNPTKMTGGTASSYYDINFLPMMMKKITLTGKLPDQITQFKYYNSGPMYYSIEPFILNVRYQSSTGTQRKTISAVEELEFKDFDFNNCTSIREGSTTMYPFRDLNLKKLTFINVDAKNCILSNYNIRSKAQEIIFKDVFSSTIDGIDGYSLFASNTAKIIEVENITFSNCCNMFFTSETLESLKFNNIVIKGSLEKAFKDCEALEEINFDSVISTVPISLYSTFESCAKLKRIVITSNIMTNNIRYMCNTSNLEYADLSGVTSDSDINCSYLFNSCKNLQYADISGIDFTKITTSSYYTNMFYYVPKTCTIIVKDQASADILKAKFPDFTFTPKS